MFARRQQVGVAGNFGLKEPLIRAQLADIRECERWRALGIVKGQPIVVHLNPLCAPLGEISDM